MRKDCIHYLFIFLSLNFPARGFTASNSNIKIIERSPNRIVLSLQPFQLKLDQIVFNNRNYYIPAIKNYGREAETGRPMLPMAAFLLPLTDKKINSITILEGDYDLIPEVNILPNFESVNNQIFETLNQTEQFWPEKIAKIESYGFKNGQRFARIQINPIQYNAAQKTLKIYNNLKIEISLSPEAAPQPLQSNKDRVSRLNKTVPDWHNPALKYYKLYLSEDGIYALTYDELNSKATLPPNALSQNIRVINNGSEIPIWIEGDENGFFSQNSTIYFYGKRNRAEQTFYDFFSDTSVYWLTFDQSPGKRYELQSGQSSAPISPFYIKTHHLETDSLFYQDNKTSAIDEGEGWIWGYLFDNDIFNLSINTNDLYTSGGNALLKFKVQGTTRDNVRPDHHLSLSINNQSIYDDFFDDKEELQDSTNFNTTILKAGENSFNMQLIADTGAQINRIYYDWIELKYPAFYMANDDHSIQFSHNLNSPGLLKRTLFNFQDTTLFLMDFFNEKIWKPDSRKTSYLAVESAALNDGSFVQFSLDFESHRFISRGHNLAILNDEISFMNFDTFREGNADDMAEVIEGLPENTIVLAGIADEGSAEMTERAHLALESLGSALSRTIGFRDSWSFIGWKGAQSGDAAESVSKRFNGPAVISDTLFDEKATRYAYTFTDNNLSGSQYYGTTVPGLKSISKIEKDTFVDLKSEANSADYIIITHSKFKESANVLADYRALHNNFRTAVIDVNEIYDEFNYGVLNEKSLKEFVTFAVDNWQPPSPKYILFFGDASWDPKLRSAGASKINYVPTYGTLVSDNWFVTLDGTDDFLPDLFIGRIPVENQEQAQIAVNKIIEYEQLEYDNWNKEFLFMNGGSNEFEQNIFQLQANALNLDFLNVDPVRVSATNLNKTTTEPITRLLKKDAQNKIEDGVLWVNFIGHGASRIWDIDIGQPDEWRNEKVLPFITGMSCHSGRFANPILNSLSEEFFLHPRGVAAYWGSSGFGYINQDYFLLQGLLKAVSLDSVRSLGEATTAAKYYLWEQQGDSERNRFVINQYVLIGDPAMHLRLPIKPEFSVKPEDILFDSNLILISDSTTTVRAKIDNFGLVPTDSISIDFKSQNSSGVLSTIKTVKLAKLENSDTTSVSWDIPNVPGEYKISVNMDPEDKFEEENELNNQASQAVDIFASDLLPIKPTINGVIKINKPKLLVSNSKNNTSNLGYFFELDTNVSFSSSNYLGSGQIEEQDLVTFWEPTISNPGNYYWRVRTHDGETFGSWSNSTFLFSANTEAGWHQSGSQYSGNNFEKTTIGLNGSSLAQNRLTFRAESAGFFEGSFGLIYVNDQALGQSRRGHNIVILDPSDGSFIDYYNVDTFGDVNASDSLAAIINTLENNTFILAAIADEGSVQLTEIAHLAIESIGSQYTRQIGRRDSWAIIGRKGAPIGSVPERLVLAGEGPAVVVDTLNRHAKTGTMASTEIGPALAWQSANFEFISENTTESIAFDIIARNSSSGRIDTLIRDSRDTNVSLTDIDAKLYPKIQLQVTLQSEDGLSTPLLKSWSVDYKPPPDLVVGNESILLNKDTVQTAEQLNLAIDSGNFGLSASDSFTIRISMAEKGQAPQQAQLMRVPGIPVDEFASYETVLSTENLRGRVTLNIEMDALNEIPEINESNNLTSSEFWVVDDTLSPDIRLTFDGREITHDEFVALSPRIMIEINDSGAVQFTDTSQVTIFLDNDKIPFGVGSGQAEFIPNSNPGDNELKATVLFTPTLTDGDHVLEIIAKDISDNSKYISNNFIVSEDFSLTNVMNYPNPFNRTTEFTYIITQPADGVKIKIFTVAGRLIMILDNLPTRVGFNQFLWDGRDRDGDRIANGVYLYKIIARQSSRQAEVIEKLVIMR